MAIAGQPHGSAAHRAGFAVVAALAGAVVLVLVASGSLRSAGTFAQRGALLQDDVTHDGALGAVFSGGRVSRGARGRQHRGGLSKDASMSDFFKAALDGDFSKGGTVKAATSGIFDNSRTNPGTQRALSRRESRELKAPRRAREQALAELRVKAAHAALAAEAHADRSHTCSDAPSGPLPIHLLYAISPHPCVLCGRRVLQNPVAAEKAAGLRVAANSKEAQMLAMIKKKEQKLAQKYPSEDKFVARYTGSVPNDDVPVDSFTFGSYVPI
jgi:hypothetical protein